MSMTEQIPAFMEWLNRARKVLAGLDEAGNPSHPHQFGEGVISFADGEGIRRPHPSVVGAGVTALLETKITSLEKYFFLKRFEELDNKIAEMFIEEGIDEERARNICISTGTSHIFNAFFYSVAKPGDIFLTAPGYYHSLASWCYINNVALQCVQTQRSNDYKLTPADLDSWYSEQRGRAKKPKGIILFNPTYTGAVYTKEELSRIAEYVAENDLVVIEDSLFMYTMFNENDKIHHLASFEEVKDRVVTVHGGSKAYGLANMRIGWACGAKVIIERMNFYISATQVDAPHVSKVMALAALQAPNEYLLSNRRELQKRAQLVMDLVEQANKLIMEYLDLPTFSPILEVLHRPKAGHSILLSLNQIKGMKTNEGYTITDSIDVSRYFLSEAKVCLSPGLSMGFSDCTVRISYGCVGLEHTYEYSKTIELVSILKEVMGRLDTNVTFEQLTTMMGISESKLENMYVNSHKYGFEKGRELIKEGIIDRMVPAIIKLVSNNYNTYSLV